MYPPNAPTLSGDVASIHRFLKDPTAVRRRVNELQHLKFVSDFIFPEKVEVAGTAVYEISDGVYLNKEAEAVLPGAEYPRMLPTDGAAAIILASGDQRHGAGDRAGVDHRDRVVPLVRHPGRGSVEAGFGGCCRQHQGQGGQTTSTHRVPPIR